MNRIENVSGKMFHEAYPELQLEYERIVDGGLVGIKSLAIRLIKLCDSLEMD